MGLRYLMVYTRPDGDGLTNIEVRFKLEADSFGGAIEKAKHSMRQFPGWEFGSAQVLTKKEEV